jgi:hypothetical protein
MLLYRVPSYCVFVLAATLHTLVELLTGLVSSQLSHGAEIVVRRVLSRRRSGVESIYPQESVLFSFESQRPYKNTSLNPYGEILILPSRDLALALA